MRESVQRAARDRAQLVDEEVYASLLAKTQQDPDNGRLGAHAFLVMLATIGHVDVGYRYLSERNTDARRAMLIDDLLPGVLGQHPVGRSDVLTAMVGLLVNLTQVATLPERGEIAVVQAASGSCAEPSPASGERSPDERKFLNEGHRVSLVLLLNEMSRPVNAEGALQGLSTSLLTCR